MSSILQSPSHVSQLPSTARIVAADIAEGLLEKLSERKAELEGESEVWRRLEVRQWDARDLSADIQDGEVSHLLSTYAYFAFAGEKDALSEAHRVLAPGGLFVETSMGFTEWGHLASFFSEVRPDKPIPGPGAHWGSVEGVKATLEGAGFVGVEAREFPISLPYETHQAAVDFVFQVFPWVEAYTADMSEGEVERSREGMVGFVRGRHPEEPFALEGTGVIGWGKKG